MDEPPERWRSMSESDRWDYDGGYRTAQFDAQHDHRPTQRLQGVQCADDLDDAWMFGYGRGWTAATGGNVWDAESVRR